MLGMSGRRRRRRGRSRDGGAEVAGREGGKEREEGMGSAKARPS
jgi:hypothetical protein